MKLDLKGITLSIIKTQAKNVQFESAFKRV